MLSVFKSQIFDPNLALAAPLCKYSRQVNNKTKQTQNHLFFSIAKLFGPGYESNSDLVRHRFDVIHYFKIDLTRHVKYVVGEPGVIPVRKFSDLAHCNILDTSKHCIVNISRFHVVSINLNKRPPVSIILTTNI